VVAVPVVVGNDETKMDARRDEDGRTTRRRWTHDDEKKMDALRATTR